MLRLDPCCVLIAGLLTLHVNAAMAGEAEPSPALQEFRQEHGEDWSLRLDVVSGRPRLLVGGAIPWSEGPSKRLTSDELAALGSDFLRRHAELLGLRLERGELLSPEVTDSGGGRLRALSFRWGLGGVPIESARLLLVVSRGNLIAVHSSASALPSAALAPALDGAEAFEVALRAADSKASRLEVYREPELVWLPEADAFRLSWKVELIERSPPRRRIAFVDAVTAAVHALSDETVEQCSTDLLARRVVGGVKRDRADDPERVELLPGVTVGAVRADFGGLVEASPASWLGTLTGPELRIACQDCSAPVVAGAPAGLDGTIDFGVGGVDQLGNGTSTPADRTAWHHADFGRRHALRWLDLPWLRGTLPIRTNVPASCNAYWSGFSLSFLRSDANCANTGEIRDVILHELGHGMDSNDGLPSSPLGLDAATGEAVGDIIAMLVDRDACIGESFFSDSGRWPSDACDGVRDLDEKAAGGRGSLSTADVASRCRPRPGYQGPLGGEGHCEGEVFGQAFWHLARNLIDGVSYEDGTPLPDGALPEEAAWDVLEDLFYSSRPLLASYAPSHLQSIGLSAHEAFLMADDEGDGLANGTPHAGAIREAFLHHGIAELVALPDAAPCAAPAEPVVVVQRIVDVASGLPALELTWSDVAAASYRVLRGLDADDSFLEFARVDGAAPRVVVDRALLPGRSYRYRIVAENADGCRSEGTPVAPPLLGGEVRVAALRIDDSVLGNGNGVLEEGERADLFADLENVGDLALSAVDASLLAPGGGVTILAGGPIAYGDIAPGATVPAPAAFRVEVLTGAPQPISFIVSADADEGCPAARIDLTVAVVDLGVDGQQVVEIPGDGDGQWEENESADVIVSLGNRGLLDAVNVVGRLSFRDPPQAGLSISGNRSEWALVSAGASLVPPSAAPFRIDAAAVGPRRKVVLELELTVDGQPHAVHELSVTVGGLPPGQAEWSAPALAQLTPLVLALDDDDGDGAITPCDVPEVIYTGTTSSGAHGLIAVSGDGGALLWELEDECVGTHGHGTIAGGDINGDGRNELLVSNGRSPPGGSDADMVCAVSWDGNVLWRAPGNFGQGGLQVWDLDGDGTVEVVAGATVLDGVDGALRWAHPRNTFGRSVVADFDLDGSLEVVVPRRSYDSVVYRANGDVMQPGFPEFVWHGAALNLDADPEPEFVTATWGVVHAYDTDGTPLWSTETFRAVVSQSPMFCAADFDGDGFQEIAVASTADISLIEEDGSFKWRHPHPDDTALVSGCATFDFDRDGTPEIVQRGRRRLVILDAVDGEELWSTEAGSVTETEMPVVADIDGDGSAEIVVTDTNAPGDVTFSLRVFGNPAWAGARAIWNQEDYSVSNVDDFGRPPPSPLPQWRGRAIYKGQVNACPCGGPRASIAVELPDCEADWPGAPLPDPLTACFELDVVGGRAPIEVEWDFGEGPVDAGPRPCHRFADLGVHFVTARVVDWDGCEHEASIPVELAGSPSLSIDGPTEVCLGESACFTASVTGGAEPVEVWWDWGDGTALSSGLDACHVHGAAGLTRLTAFAEDALGCRSETAWDVNVVVDPVVPELGGAGGEPLRVRLSAPDAVALTWEDPTIPGDVHEGDLDELWSLGYAHSPRSGCELISGESVSLEAGSRYLLVVGSLPACAGGRVEGSYGRSSFGVERPSSADLGLPTCR